MSSAGPASPDRPARPGLAGFLHRVIDGGSRGLGLAFPLVVAILFVRACAEDSPRDLVLAQAVFEVEVAGLERFRIKLVDPGTISAAESRLESGARASLSGELRAGDGGFNAPYRWHLEPASIRFESVRRDACDALPLDVEEDLERWMSEVGEYCPWAARVVGRER